MTKIDFNRENFNKCICGGCPVLAKSPCTIEQEKKLAPQKELIQKESKMPNSKEMSGVYCADAVGKSACNDLDDKKACLCPACPLAIMKGLKNNYYCTKGSAEEVG